MTNETQQKGWLLPLIAVIGLIAAFGLAVGYSLFAISFRVIYLGGSPTINGLQAGAAGLGIILGSLLTPWLAVRFGAWPTATTALFASAVTIVVSGLIFNPTYYVGLRLISGIVVSALFIVSETWINQLAPDTWRGRIIGIYTSTIAATFSIGLLLVPILGYKDFFPWAVTGGLLLLFALPLLVVRSRMPALEPVPLRRMVVAITRIPILLLAVVAFGYVDSVILGLFTVYGLAKGLTEAVIAYMVSVFIVGNVLLQVPIGYLADKTSNRFAMRWIAFMTVLAAASLPLLNFHGIYIWGHLMVFGATAFGVYTLSMAIIGKHLQGGELIAANAAFGIAWGVGAAIGSSLTGWGMENFTIEVLPLSIAFLFFILAAALFLWQPIGNMPPEKFGEIDRQPDKLGVKS